MVGVQMRLLGMVLPLALGMDAPAAEAAVAKPLYVYQGAGCDGRRELPKFERFVGRKVDGVIDFVSQVSWYDFDSSAPWILRCWKDSGYQLSLAVPMLPGKSSGTLAGGAKGAYDHHFRKLAEALVANGFQDADLRIGWEFNGGWYAWSAKPDPKNFVAYFRRIVKVMRSVPGQRFRINFNPNLGIGQISPESVYPGDDVVDVIGVDIYNSSWNSFDALAEARWQQKLWEPFGLNWLASFSKKRGKRISIPEWGTGTRPDGKGAGDDPLFIDRMADWIAGQDVVYHGYWDYPAVDYNARLSTGEKPEAGAMFKRRFGPSSATAEDDRAPSPPGS